MNSATGWPHMLPCPFCGGDARHDAHADDCYFILHRKFKNSGADMSPAFEVLAAWNRRTPQPTQAAPPAGREPLTEDQRSDIATAAAGFNWTDDYVEAIDYVIDGVECLHGIKGGQHGAE